MNKIFLKSLLATVLSLSAGTVSAATAIGEDWVGGVFYWFYDDGHAAVNDDANLRGPDYSGRVVIPATVTYNGTTYNVTEIGEYAFRGSSVTDVIMPEGLKKIGRSQFWGCDNLKSITIPGTVTEIGFDAFNDYSNYFGDPAIETITFEDSAEPLTGFIDSAVSATIQLGENVKTVYLGRNADLSWGENVENATVSGIVTELSGFVGSTALKTLTIEYGDTPLFLGRTGDGEGLFSNHPIETLTLNRQLDYDATDGISPFAGIEELKTVSIGDMVTSLGDDLFNGCAGLQSLYMGAGLQSIGNNTFLGCTGLQHVEVKNLSAWCQYDFTDEGQNPLYYAKSLYVDGNLVTDLVVPSGVSAVKPYAFYGCASLKSLTIPSTVGMIGEGAFRECTALKSLTLEDGGTLTFTDDDFNRPFRDAPLETLYLGRSIAKKCFAEDLASLKKLTVGNNITEFEEEYFENCNKLEEVHVSNLSAWCRINFEDLLSNPLSKAHKLYMSGSLMTDLAIPSDISAIKPYAFYGGECFTSLSLHDGMTDLGEYAFYGCSGLTSFDLPASISVLNRYVFAGCSGLETVTIPATVKNVYTSAFAKCTGIKQVTFEDSQDDLEVKLYFDYYPYNDYSAGDLFENSVIEKMYVGRNITLENSSYRVAVSSYLSSLTISGNVTKIGNIFGSTSETGGNSQHPAFQELIIEDSDVPLLISEGAFLGINGSDYYMYVGRNLKKDTEFKSSPFSYWLSSVELGPNVTEIIPYMFYECCRYTIYGDVMYGLTEVSIDGDIESIGESAFADCGALASFDMSDGVVYIGDDAFKNCEGLTYFDIPARVASMGASAFEGCTGLTSLRFESGSALGNIAARTFYGCTGLLSVNLPENITEIGESAFYGCTGLLSVNLPENITEIGESAFYGCTGLVSMSVPANVTSIGDNAFYDCSGMAMLSLGESLESIGESAFYNCSVLTDLHLPQTVKNVGNKAFYNCLSLMTVKVDNPEPPVAYANTFSVDTYLNASLSVPEGSVDAYNMAECWYNFRNKSEFPSGSVGAIGEDTLKVYFKGANLVVEGAGEDAMVEVYNIAGLRVYCGNAASVALDNGIYIVRVAGHTFKVAL